MTRHARGAILVAALTAIGQVALVAATTGSPDGPPVPLLIFVVGPLLFLDLLAWRRRSHPGRSRLLLRVAMLAAIGGLGLLAFDYLRHRSDPPGPPTMRLMPLIVPLIQWTAIAAIWLALVIREARENPVANKNP